MQSSLSMHVNPPPSLDHLWIPLRNDVCPKMGYHRCHSLNADFGDAKPFLGRSQLLQSNLEPLVVHRSPPQGDNLICENKTLQG